MATSPNRSKQKSASPILAIGVLFVVGGILIAVIYVGGMKKRLKRERAEAAAEAEEVEAEQEAVSDPFEAEPAETEPVKRSRVSSESDDPFASLDDPFASTYVEQDKQAIPSAGALTGSKLWKQAMEEASAAGGRLMLAAEAREQGDPAEERAYREEAIEVLEEALSTSKEWVERTVSKYSPEDVQVRSITRMRKKWADQAKELRELIKN